MNNATIRLIYDAFKNCAEYFKKMSEFDGAECNFNQIIKKIKSFFSRKQLFESEYKGRRYASKKIIVLNFDYLTPISFMEVCLFAVICNCNIDVNICFEDNFATNELILTLVNKTAQYYGFDKLVSLNKIEKDINAMCSDGKVLILRMSRKYSRLNQKDLLILEDDNTKN